MQFRELMLKWQAVSVARVLNVALVAALLMGLVVLIANLLDPSEQLIEAGLLNLVHSISLVLIAVVVSFRHKLEQEARQSEARERRHMQAMLSMFSVVKHELNNDMQVVMGNAELAGMLVETGGDVAQPVDKISEAATLAIEHIKQLSVFSAGNDRALVSTDLNALLRETVARMSTEIPSIVTVQLELDRLPSRVMADRNLLGLSLSYLIRLAVGTLQHGGEIVIKTRILEARSGTDLINALAEIHVVHGLGGTVRDAKTVARDAERHSKAIRVLEQARSTTRALVERGGAIVMMGGAPNEALLKMGFIGAQVTVDPQDVILEREHV